MSEPTATTGGLREFQEPNIRVEAASWHVVCEACGIVNDTAFPAMAQRLAEVHRAHHDKNARIRAALATQGGGNATE